MSNPQEASPVALELGHEEECIDTGAVKYDERHAKRRTKGQESLLDYGQRAMALIVPPTAKAIADFLKPTTRAGRRHSAAKHIETIDPNAAACITARVVTDRISSSASYQVVALNVGRRIEEELMFTSFQKQNAGLYATVWENMLKHNPNAYQEQIRVSILRHAMTKFELEWCRWSKPEKFHVGAKLLDLLIGATGLFRLENDPSSKHGKVKNIVAVPELLQKFEDYKHKARGFCPDLQPMMIPPLDWCGLFGGGYYHPKLQQKVRLFHSASRGYVAELESTDMPEVYRAVNLLQSTPWRINTAVLSIVQDAWEAGMDMTGIPRKRDELPPTRPEYDENDPASKKRWSAWKERAADIYRRNKSDESKRFAVMKTLSLAEKFADTPALYFPHRLDFRGRMYAVPKYLTPQGSDLAKGLLILKHGRPLTERGAWWLSVHLANCFGYDKVSLQDRAAWTLENSGRIEASAADPLAERLWLEADKPFQFLAAAIEWYGYRQEGVGYVCHLPVMVDGSCNGLQHFSALLRDEVCGPLVNLVPADRPGDVYAEVARATTAKLMEIAHNLADPKRALLAEKWLAFGVSRSLAKRPVMILPYGGTPDSAARYLEEAVREERMRMEEVFGSKVKGPCAFLAHVMWKVMAGVVVGPRKAMTWLQQSARLCAKAERAMVWTTPAGFKVRQDYHKTAGLKVKTKIGGKFAYFLIDDGGAERKPDAKRYASAISPNFVHSLDAAALQLTINRCADLGVSEFVAVHDSYGTHPNDMDTLARTLRRVFVEIYEEGDVLERFAAEMREQLGDEAELPPLPAKGSLDVAGVLSSEFFFS